jgi:hypothetical protein
MTFDDIIKIGLASGVVASIVTATLEWLRARLAESRARERDAQYLAAHLATNLEQFAVACAAMISDTDLHNSSGGHAGRQSFSFPRLNEFAKDAEWKALDPALGMAILTLHSEIAVGDYSVEFAKDVLDPDSVADEACDQAA